MDRVQHSTAVTTLPTPSFSGTKGYYGNGNAAQGISPTFITADQLNLMQEELMEPVEFSGQTPSHADNNQLRKAIQSLSGNSTPIIVNNTTKNLTTADLGSTVICEGGSSSIVNLPALSTVPISAKFTIVTKGSNATVNANGSDDLFVNGTNAGNFSLATGTFGVVVKIDESTWQVVIASQSVFSTGGTGSMPLPVNVSDDNKWLKAFGGSASWENIVSADIISYLGYTPVNKAGDTITGDLTIQGNSTVEGDLNVEGALTSITHVPGTNNNLLATTAYAQDLAWRGNDIRIIDSGRKGGNVFGIIRNNQVFVSGLFANHISKANTVNISGFVPVPFQKPQQIPSGTTIVDAVFCGFSLFVVLSNGWCYSMGFNPYGHLGHGNTTQQYSLKRIEYFVSNSISIDKVYAPRHMYCDDETGYLHVHFRGTNGTLYGAGYNGSGELGIGNFTTTISTPTAVLGISNVIQLSCGAFGGGHTIAVSSDNPKQVWTWGYNASSQLGNGNTTNQHTPAVRYTHASNITKVVSGHDFYFNGSSWAGYGMSMFLAGGEIWGCGSNGLGQLGDGTTVNKSSFTKATGSQVWVDFDVSGGAYPSAMAIDSNGAVWGTGYNGYGQLGDGTTTNRSQFTISNITSDAVSVKAVTYSTYGVTVVKKSDGYLYGTGYNGYGSLSQGTAAYGNVLGFAVMAGPLGYQAQDYQILSDLYHRYENCMFMLTTDGSLLASGLNQYGIMANKDVGIGYYTDGFNYCELQK
jgi:alpha-tubulin suppressor-like RCC1 family protein